MTVARLLLEVDGPSGGLQAGTVIVVDEASMIGTRDLVCVVTAARAAGGAVKLIGDPDQHGAVDVGGVFRRLCADRGDDLVALVENNRQQDHIERLAVSDYREGRIADALARYDDAGKVVRSRTAGESFDAIVADWYAARVNGVVDPMIAGPNSTRRALNERARVLLKVNHEIVGPALAIAGREFMAGDEVVARRNDRTLHATGSRDFVKNGSAGTIVAIDAESEQLVVDFEREGTIRVPRRYLAAGHLEHGYARTTYGVQGSTHDVARYHPTDVSSFEEGYVAITRARKSVRIYVVDGTLPGPDLELTHAPAEPQAFGMNEVAQALARRRSGHMAADATSNLTAVAATLDGRTLAELTTRRRELGLVLAATPADTAHVIEESRCTLEALRARRRAWTTTLRQAQQQGANNTGDDLAMQITIRRAASALRHLDRRATSVERKLDAATRQQLNRSDWLADHADMVVEFQMTQRAERARENQIRIAAIHQPSDALVQLVGPEPALQRERQVWKRAVETVALYTERYGIAAGTGTGIESVLGACPRDPLAAADHADAAATIADAAAELVHAELSASAEL